MATLELYDGSTTLNLLDSTHNAQLSTLQGLGGPPRTINVTAETLRSIEEQPRQFSVTLVMSSTTVALLRTAIQNLEEMLAVATERRRLAQGTVVVLKTQMGSTDADDVEYRVLSGQFVYPPSALDDVLVSKFYQVGGTLSLVLEPMGRLAEVTPSTGTLENEVDSTNLNYMDLNSLSGTSGGRLNIRIDDANNGGGTPWNGSKKIWIAKRSGSRQTDTLFFQTPDAGVEGTNPFSAAGTFSTPAGLTTNASGGSSSSILWTNTGGGTWTSTRVVLGYHRFDITTIPNGLFRGLVRVSHDTSEAAIAPEEVGVGLGWVLGSLNYTPVDDDDVPFPTTANQDEWHILDLGEINLPVGTIPDGLTAPTQELRIYHTVTVGTSPTATGDTINVDIDFLFLLPIDEGAVIVDSVGTNDRVFIDGQSQIPGVYILNTSNVVQTFATAVGGPFRIGPENTRLYWLRDDTGDPTTIQATVTPEYLPLVPGV